VAALFAIPYFEGEVGDPGAELRRALLYLTVATIIGFTVQYIVARLRTQTRELESANRELAAASEIQSRFVSMVAHELRTPLTSISGFATTLLSYDVTEPDRTRFISIIDEQALRLTRLTDDLLTVSKITADAVSTHPQPVNVAATVEHVLEKLHREGIEVHCPRSLVALADIDHFEQILVNYISNAEKYGHAPITVSGKANNGWVELRVCDTGDGVPDAFVPQLFTEFSRAPSTADIPGTGLGLAIVRGLARAQGGDSFFMPNSPRGACFGVRIPAAVGVST
jgi:signal transduction histidine kinase